MPFMGILSVRRLGKSHANHAVAGDQTGEFVLAESFGAGGPLRKNEIAKLRVAIPDAHLNFLRKLDAKLLQDAPRVDNRARPVRRRLVPVRGQSKRRPRIAGAQRANDHVVDVVSVLHDHHVFALYARIAKLLDGFGSIAQEPLLVFRIRPRLGDDAGPVVRANLVLISVYELVDSDGVEQLLFDQQRFYRFYAERYLRGPVFVMMLMVVISAHTNLPVYLNKEGQAFIGSGVQSTTANVSSPPTNAPADPAP